MNDILERITTYMKTNDIKQKDIAEKGDMSNAFVSKVLNGKKPISNKFLRALSDITGKSSHYWLFGTDEYIGLASLNKLIDTFIEDGSIKDDGSFDENIEEILMIMLKKEIKDKINNKKKR